MKAIHIVIADDHPLVRKGLADALSDELDIKIISEASDGATAWSLLKQFKPDVLLLDIDMPKMTGLELLEKKKQTSDMDSTKIIILTMHHDSALLNKCIRNGAGSYLLKSIEPFKIAEVIRKVHAQGHYYLPEMMTEILENPQVNSHGTATNPIAELTEREREVLEGIARGLTNVQIGEKLFISARTVDTHRTNLMKKLNVHNVASLVRIALQNGLVD